MNGSCDRFKCKFKHLFANKDFNMKFEVQLNQNDQNQSLGKLTYACLAHDKQTLLVFTETQKALCLQLPTLEQ